MLLYKICKEIEIPYILLVLLSIPFNYFASISSSCTPIASTASTNSHNMASMASTASTGSHTNISNTNSQQPLHLPRLHQPQLTNGLIDVPCPPLMTASMASNSRVSAAMVPVASSAPSMEHIPRSKTMKMILA